MEQSSLLSKRTLAACFRVLLTALLFAGLAAGAPRPALAAGSVTIANREPEESDGKWKLNMAINYGGVPHVAHISMVFSFTPTALYERSYTDASGDKIVHTRKPLSGQQAINESMDVGFTDGSGKTFATTKFDFVLRRDRSFEAGEYTLKITRASDGVQVGQPQTIKLKGDNEIVDRRAMVFAGDKKKEKKAAPSDKTGEASDPVKPNAENAAASEDGAPKDADPSAGAPAVESPPPVPPKQGGCGCRVAGDPGGVSSLPVLALGITLLLRRTRRRGASSSCALRLRL